MKDRHRNNETHWIGTHDSPAVLQRPTGEGLLDGEWGGLVESLVVLLRPAENEMISMERYVLYCCMLKYLCPAMKA